MNWTRLALVILPISFIGITSSCSQNLKSNLPSTKIFTGSTPCDSLIKSLLQIAPSATCEFLKWELSFFKDNDTFELTALYGKSQPNTNGFIGGGTKIMLSGIYTVSQGAGSNPAVNVYNLDAGKLNSPILLVEMDSNILHFADADKNFIVGNGGWGYVLNRVE